MQVVSEFALTETDFIHYARRIYSEQRKSSERASRTHSLRVGSPSSLRAYLLRAIYGQGQYLSQKKVGECQPRHPAR